MPRALARVYFDEKDVSDLCSPARQFAVQYLHDRFGSPEIILEQIASSIVPYPPTRTRKTVGTRIAKKNVVGFGYY